VVEALEQAFRSRKPAAETPSLPQWSEATDALMGVVRDVYPAVRS